jgi:hypothetical protein
VYTMSCVVLCCVVLHIYRLLVYRQIELAMVLLSLLVQGMQPHLLNQSTQARIVDTHVHTTTACTDESVCLYECQNAIVGSRCAVCNKSRKAAYLSHNCFCNHVMLITELVNYAVPRSCLMKL